MGIEEVPVFRPTEEEFTSGFVEYINKIEPLCVGYGLAKIIPPANWNPREKNWFKNIDLTIPSPIQQYVDGLKGVYQAANVVLKPKTLKEFMECAEKASSSRIATTDEDIERRFWKNIRFEAPIYGADMVGTLFSDDVKHWNIGKLDSLLKYLDAQVQGVNTAYLYFGMWKAMFAWHTEDMDLFSINFLHFGEPKKWYCIPSSERTKFEEVAKEYFGELYKECPEFLRHKTTIISPTLLKSKNVPVYTMVQREREIMVTFPGSYHCGFNFGFNCAESVNFATESWVNFGIKAKYCRCRTDTVRIFMRNFLDRYKTLANKDITKFEELLAAQPVEYIYETIITGEEEEEEFEEDADADDSGVYEEKSRGKATGQRNKRKRMLVKSNYSTRSKKIKGDETVSPKHTISLSQSNISNNFTPKTKINQDQRFLPLVNIDTINLMPSLIPTTCLPSILYNVQQITNAKTIDS